MRWHVIAVVVCAERADAFACPSEGPPYVLITGKELTDDRLEIPAGAKFYVSLAAFPDGLPTFRGENTELVPMVVTPTPVEDVVALTLPIQRGEVRFRDGHPESRSFVVVDRRPATRSATREIREDFELWKLDSDATLFRVETDRGIDYEFSNGWLMVDFESTIVALHSDGTEELIYLRDRSPEVPWWVLGLVLTGLGGAWIARRYSSDRSAAQPPVSTISPSDASSGLARISSATIDVS